MSLIYLSLGEFENALRQCRSQSILKKANNSIRSRAVGDSNDGGDGGDVKGFSGNDIAGSGSGSGSGNKKQPPPQQEQQQSIIDGTKALLPTATTVTGSRPITNGGIATDNVGSGSGIFELYRRHTNKIR